MTPTATGRPTNTTDTRPLRATVNLNSAANHSNKQVLSDALLSTLLYQHGHHLHSLQKLAIHRALRAVMLAELSAFTVAAFLKQLTRVRFLSAEVCLFLSGFGQKRLLNT